MRFFVLILFALIAISFAQDSGSTDSYYSYDWDSSEESLEERILGGSIVTDIKQYSYQVGLINVKEETAEEYLTSNCGGSLIHTEVVLTAAHCLIDPIYVLIFHGTTLQAELDSPGNIRVEPGNCKIHENYDASKHDNDIAVINLPQPIILDDYTTIIPLAATYDSCFGVGEASGWGQIDTLTQTNKLHAVNVTTMDYQTCGTTRPFVIKDQHLCIDGTEYKGVCSGDSGGPFVRFTDDGERCLCGVSSFIMGDRSEMITDKFGVKSVKCRNNKPKIFTSTVYYYGNQWICSNSNYKVGCKDGNVNGNNKGNNDYGTDHYVYIDDFLYKYRNGVLYPVPKH